ncbi:hypothetical protein SACS_1142 [Parasaccharibacter apium]|uniref:Uncharacterized protein n=1 Tax=Parasaccharibacter apium TaxID=1510841 RepID=A0A7U7G668_9PROT|nr:hypothetical protein SACS_1142 [Parasaccharibacter apium]
MGIILFVDKAILKDFIQFCHNTLYATAGLGYMAQIMPVVRSRFFKFQEKAI